MKSNLISEADETESRGEDDLEAIILSHHVLELLRECNTLPNILLKTLIQFVADNQQLSCCSASLIE